MIVGRKFPPAPHWVEVYPTAHPSPTVRVIARQGRSAVGNPGGGGPKLGSAHRSPSSGRKSSRPHAQQCLVRWPPQRHGCQPWVVSWAPHGHGSRRQAASASTSAAMAASRLGVSGVRRYGVTRGSSPRRANRTSVRYFLPSHAPGCTQARASPSPSPPDSLRDQWKCEWVARRASGRPPPSATRPQSALSRSGRPDAPGLTEVPDAGPRHSRRPATPSPLRFGGRAVVGRLWPVLVAPRVPRRRPVTEQHRHRLRGGGPVPGPHRDSADGVVEDAVDRLGVLGQVAHLLWEAA